MNRIYFFQMKAFLLALTLFTVSGFPLDQSSPFGQPDLSKPLKSAGINPENSALLVVCLEDGSEWVHGGFRTEAMYPPASTSKIPHTLIALEEGYGNGLDTNFEWDGQERFRKIWNQDHTLSSAFEHAVIWVYQQITCQLGYKTMSRWINQLEYGNRNIGDAKNITTYWLNGPLKTSVRDQVQFLSKLICQKLPIQEDNYELVKGLMQQESGQTWVLYAKGGFISDIGWYVGWVESIKNGIEQTYVFAFNVVDLDWSQLPLRKAAVKAALNALGIISEEKASDAEKKGAHTPIITP